jgi:hypothetical protein
MRYSELISEYKTALALWSEVRCLYPPGTPEVMAATSHLKALEGELNLYNKQSALAA